MAESTVRRSKSFGADHGLIHEAVVTGRKVGAGEDFWKSLAHDQELFRELVDHVEGRTKLRRRSGVRIRVRRASEIMARKNFHGPEEVKRRLGIDIDRSDYAWVPFSEPTLRALADTHVLVATPAISISTMMKKFDHLFASGTSEGWPRSMDLTDEKFVDVETEPGWYLVNKKPVSGSTARQWSTQQKAVLYPDYVFEANVGVFAHVIHFTVQSGEPLFGRPHSVGPGARTATLSSSGAHVCLTSAAYGRKLVIESYDSSDSSMGIASARLPS